MNGQTQFTKIVKRNGDVAEFRPEKIEQAIFKAMRAAGRPDRAAARRLAGEVIAELAAGGEAYPACGTGAGCGGESHLPQRRFRPAQDLYALPQEARGNQTEQGAVLEPRRHRRLSRTGRLAGEGERQLLLFAPGAQPAHIDEHHFAVLARQTLYGRDSPGPSFRCAAHSRPRLSECLLRGLGPARPASGRLQGGGR